MWFPIPYDEHLLAVTNVHVSAILPTALVLLNDTNRPDNAPAVTQSKYISIVLTGQSSVGTFGTGTCRSARHAHDDPSFRCGDWVVDTVMASCLGHYGRGVGFYGLRIKP